MVYLAVNKPKGYVSTNADPAGRPRVVDLVPDIPERVFAVGRLDEASIGLMILTNDGELANKLTHPKYGVEKVYRAVVAGSPTPEVLAKVTEGVWLSEGKVRAKHVRIAGKQGEATILEMVLAEGKNREVRRMLAQMGHKVMSLTRVTVGPISLKGLKPGAWRHLTAHEVDLLRKVADGIPVPSGRRFEERPVSGPRRGAPRPDRVPARPPEPRPAVRPAQPPPSPEAPPRPAGTGPRLRLGTSRPRTAPPPAPRDVPPPPQKPRGPKILGMTGSVRRLDNEDEARPGTSRRTPPRPPRSAKPAPLLKRRRRPHGPAQDG